MARVTKKNIYHIRDLINWHLATRGYSRRVQVQWAYGQPRAYLYVGNEQVEELSPRLSTGHLFRWLHAYRKGLLLGLNKGNA